MQQGTSYTVDVGAVDQAVGPSGKRIHVYQMTVTSDGTAGVAILRNGTTTGGTAWVNPTNTINKSVTTLFGQEGMLFPAGCFADVDAHCIATVITYSVEQ